MWRPTTESSWLELSQIRLTGQEMCSLPIELDGETGYLSLDAEGRRHLLLPLNSGRRYRSDKSCRGVKLGPVQLEGTGGGHYADLWCEDTSLGQLFGVIADEVVGRYRAGEGPADVVAAETLARWKDLLRRDSLPTLSREAQQGLFGELLLLDRLIGELPDPVLAWSGPDGGVHDFRTAAGAIEVKTTVQSSPRLIQIASVEQLVPPSTGPLALFVVTLRDDPGGTSLAELVKSVESRVSDKHLFWAKLTALGYRPDADDSSSDSRWSALHLEWFMVGPMFPAITPASFPEGKVPAAIARLRYEINIDDSNVRTISRTDLEALTRILLGRAA